MSGQSDDLFTLRNYLRERLPLAGMWTICLATILGASLVLGVTPWGATLLCLMVVTACIIGVAWDYLRKRAYYRALRQAIEQLESVRHLGAFVQEPRFLEGRLS